MGGEGLRHGVSLDAEPPQIVNIHAGDSWVSGNADVQTSRRRVASAGRHTVKRVDPGVVFQRVVVAMRGSRLGPPESRRV